MKKIRRQFLTLLSQQYSQQAEELALAIDYEYTLLKKDVAFAQQSKNPMDKRMPTAAYLLAVIKTLDDYRVEYETIRQLILAVAHRHARPKNRIQRTLRAIVPTLLTTTVGRYLLARVNQRLGKSSHADGFKGNIITAKEETLGVGYGVDVLECGICKLFAKHRYQAYVPLLCEVDHITTSLAGLTLLRSGTIAHGAKVCDFRYNKA